MPPDTSNPGWLTPTPPAGPWAPWTPLTRRPSRLHLPDCAECQAAVAEFEALTRALKSPAPAVEPSADLGARTLASVQHAIMTAGQPGHAKTSVRRHDGRTPAGSPPRRHRPAGRPGSQEAGQLSGPAPARMSRWWHWHWNFPVS